MNKKIIIIVAVIIVVAAAAYLFLMQKNPSPTGATGTTGTLPPVFVSTATVPSAFPTSSTITLGTNQGNVTTNNFYKNASYVTQDQQTVVIRQTPTYDINYNVSDSSFIISILSLPFDTARQAAEAEFLSALGISQQDACRLKVYEGVPAYVSDQYIGQLFPLSFCATSTFGG